MGLKWLKCADLTFQNAEPATPDRGGLEIRQIRWNQGQKKSLSCHFNQFYLENYDCKNYLLRIKTAKK